MVEFKELEVDPKKRKLIISARVKDEDIYEDVYLDSIIIDSDNTYKEGGPSLDPIYKKEVTYGKQGFSYYDRLSNASEDGKYKELNIEISEKELGVNLDNTLFFIYIVTKGTPKSETPCGADNKTTIGIAYSTKLIYDRYLKLFKEFNDCCSPHLGLTDFDLKYRAFIVCLRTRNFIKAIDFYQKFIKNSRIDNTNRCNCY